MFNTRFVPLRTAALCACLLPFALLTGCGGGSSSSSATSTATTTTNGPVTSAPRTANGLQYTLSSDKSVYKVGEVVNLTLTFANASTQSIMDAVGQPSVIVTVMQGTHLVWQTPQPTIDGGTGFGVGFTLQPGNAVTYPAIWSQTATLDSKQVASGQYTIIATLNDERSGTLATIPIQLTIAP